MVDTTGGAAGRRTERLELRVPTSRTQLPAVRAMTGDLAMRMDFDLDAVEDLRLAVDEASAALVDSVDAGPADRADVPGGDGGAGPVATITLVKELPPPLRAAAASGDSDADLSVAR